MTSPHTDGADNQTASRQFLGRLLSEAWFGAVVFTAVAFAGMFSSNVIAQTQSGLSTIQGTVTDSMGAVIRDAAIHVVSKATGVVSETKSNGGGFYQVPGLIAGTYDLSIAAPGMKTYVYTVELLAAQTAVVSPVMATGSVTQQITVQGSIVQLTDTEDGATTSTLERERIDQLPQNGRSITLLAQETTPGLENGLGLGTRANGLAGEALEYVADGVPLDNRNFGGSNASGTAQYPDPDSIQEVRIDVSGGGAQYATPATGIITTKSGTNTLHGTAFYTGRNNSVAGIAKPRQAIATAPVPNYKRNEFGVSAGGPVVLPWLYHGKDKTFWFFAFERYSLIQTTNALQSVDTPAMKGGDFSGLTTTQLYDPATTTANPACPTPGVVNGVTIWNAGPTVNNPYCRTPFGNGIMGDPGNNQIPLNRLNPVSKIIYDMTPAPNIAGITNPLQAANYNWPGINQYFVPTITWRLDHNFSENNKAYMRYTSNVQTDQYPAGGCTTAVGSACVTTIAADGISAATASSESVTPIANFAAAVGYTHVFSPTFYSETIVSQQWFSQLAINTGDRHRNYEAQLGLPNNFGEPGFPNISGFVMSKNGNQFDYGINQIITNTDENLVKTIGKHQMYFGARYRHERLGYQPDEGQDQDQAQALSTALYNPSTGGNYGTYANTGATSAGAFLGAMSHFSVGPLPPYSAYSDQEFDAYFQDNYHLRRNLTLNLGVRWEDHPAINTAGFGASYDMPNHAIVLEHPPSYYISKGLTTQAIITNMQNIGVKFETPSQAGFSGGNLLRSFPFTFGPRVGLAWQPFGDKRGTVVRGGYGRYIFPEPIRNILTARNLPFFTTYGYDNNSAAQDPDSTPNYDLRKPQTLFLGQNTGNIVNSTTLNAILPGIGGTFLDHDFAPEYVTETNLTVEQAFRDSSALRLTWNYTHASNLDYGYFANAAVSPFVWEYDTGTLPPNGGAPTIGTCQYASTALNPYDCSTYGNFNYLKRAGWSNDNSLQVNYQRLFHRGIAYQAIYVWSRPFRVGSNSTRDSVGLPLQSYPGVTGTAPGTAIALLPGGGPITPGAAPPPLPSGAPSWADFKALNRFQNYMVDPYFSSLFHHVTITGLWDLPFGRGKRFFGKANRFVDELIGGWELAGDGQVVSQSFRPGYSNWGQTSKLVTYKHNVKIQDCTSGKCFNRYMWFNGYISPKYLPPANGGICTSNCVTGLPSSYQPYEAPINNNPNYPANFGTNNVQLTTPSLVAANHGNPITVSYAPENSTFPQFAGANRFNKSVVEGPFNYVVDLSAYKVFPITERVNFRVNVDAFNALNIMGYNNPNSLTGEQSISPGGLDGSSFSLNSSWASSRQLQLTMRLTF